MFGRPGNRDVGEPAARVIELPMSTQTMDIKKTLSDPKAVRVILALILGAIGSIPLVLLTPPFQAPDEVQHFYRAFQLSDLRFRAEVRNGVAGGLLPDSLPELVKSSVYTQDGISYPPMPSPISKTMKLASIPLDASARQFVAIRGSAGYSPLPYSRKYSA